MDVALHVGMLIAAVACSLCLVLGHQRTSVSGWLGQAIMVAAMLDMAVRGQWLPPLAWSALLIVIGMYGGARGRWVASASSSGCTALGLHRALSFIVSGGLILLSAGSAGAPGAVSTSGGHAHSVAAGGVAAWLLIGVAALLAHAGWLVFRQLHRARRAPLESVETVSLGVMLAAMAASVL